MSDLASIGEAINFTLGKVICEQGEVAGDAFLVFSGKVRVVKSIQGRKPLTLSTLMRGDFFGERGLLSNEPRVATVRASEDSVVIRFAKKEFQQYLESHNPLKVYFTRLISDRALNSFLRSDTVFNSVPPKQIRSIFEKLESTSFEKDETIFEQGQKSDRFYIVRNGEVKVLQETDGKIQVLNFIGEGGCFGEIGLLDGTTRTATVIATEPTECLYLGQDDFDFIIDQVSKLKLALLEIVESYQLQPTQINTAPPRFRGGTSRQQQANTPLLDEASSDDGVYIKKRIFNRFPWLKQNDATDCGAASLGMISRYYGQRIPITRIREIANIGRDGANLHSLALAAERLGFVARPVRTDYSHLGSIQLPAVAHWKGYHFIVIYQITNDKVVIADPAIGVQKIPRKEFEESWTGHLLLLEATSALLEQPEEKNTLKRFLPLLKPHKKQLVEIILASLLINLFGLATPIFTQTIIDKVLVHQDVQMLNLMLGGMLIVGLFATTATLLRYYLLIFVSQKLSLRLSSDLFRQVMMLPMSYFAKRKIGDLLTRFGDNDKIQNLITGTAIKTFLDVMMVVVYLSVMFFYSSKLTAVALIFIPLSILVTLIFTPIMKRNNQKIFDKTAVAQSKLIESISRVEAIKASTSELTTRWKYEDMIVQLANQEFYGAKLGMLMNAFSSGIQLLSTIVVLWYGAHLVIDGQMTVGQLIAFNVLIGMVMAPILGLVGMWQTFQDAMLSLQRLNDIYDAQPEESDGKAVLVELPLLQGHIQIDNVSFRYSEDGENVLSNITLEINPGETVALVGRSGSGKTTLASLLQRLYRPSEGQIMMDGYDLSAIRVASLRSQTGVVLQDNVVFSGTIRENIALSDPGASLDRVIMAAKLANAHEFINDYPLTYETVIGEIGIGLSGGQRQRIAIARALLSDPRLLLFDEATSALDTESERAIQENMSSILEGRTSIIIAHRLSTIKNADRVVVLDKGCIVEQGTHAQLMAAKGLYYYLNVQQLGG